MVDFNTVQKKKHGVLEIAFVKRLNALSVA